MFNTFSFYSKNQSTKRDLDDDSVRKTNDPEAFQIQTTFEESADVVPMLDSDIHQYTRK